MCFWEAASPDRFTWGFPIDWVSTLTSFRILSEEVTNEYYLKHKPGQTFSSYWRERIQAEEAEGRRH
ncbi:MAG: hypothetical protein R3C49_27305 [Planctomycetaceae bacterium]